MNSKSNINETSIWPPPIRFFADFNCQRIHNQTGKNNMTDTSPLVAQFGASCGRMACNTMLDAPNSR